MTMLDPGSLDRMRDIVEPDAVSWWPPAPGWWALLAFILTVVSIFAWRLHQHWQANAYRREANLALSDAKQVQEVDRILKRAALASGTRRNVASLSGGDWCEWLSETGPSSVPAEVSVVLSETVFREGDAIVDEELRRWAADWIKHHSIPVGEEETC